MRAFLRLSIAALLWAAGSQSAEADITATYDAWGPIGPTLVVQVSDRGDARVEMGGRLVAIRRDGTMYLVRSDDRGTFVLTAGEFERIEASLMRDHPFPDDSPATENVRVVEAGTEVVGGRTGTVLLFEEEGRLPESSELAFVVSSDPDLAPVGPVMAQIFGGVALPMPEPVRRSINEVHRRGTPIRMWVLIRLTGTSSERIPASAFDLPGPVVSGEEAYRRLGRA